MKVKSAKTGKAYTAAKRGARAPRTPRAKFVFAPELRGIFAGPADLSVREGFGG